MMDVSITFIVQHHSRNRDPMSDRYLKYTRWEAKQERATTNDRANEARSAL